MSVNNISKYLIQPSKTRTFVTHLNKAGVLLPVILLEGAVTAGRTYQAHKRGGYTEARERLCEESIGAVFWLGGVKAFNALGNKLGKAYMDVRYPEFSLAEDSVRKPFDNMVREMNLEKRKKFLIGFKFTKIAAAVVMAAGLLGFVVPKMNQKITRTLLAKDKNKENKTDTEKPVVKNILSTGISMDNFVNNTKVGKPTFGMSLNTFAKLTNNLENHDVYKLLATDSGVFSGRAYNARNKDERIEILVRDLGSMYFYYRCKDDVINFLKKFDGFGGKLSNLNPMTAMTAHNGLVEKVFGQADATEKMDIEAFRNLVVGSDVKALEKTLEKFEFKNGDVIALQDFKALAEKAGIVVDEKMLEKAKLMSEIQPKRMLSDLGYETVGSVLTKQQVKDVINDSLVSDPEYIKKIMKVEFGDDLTNSYRFISNKDIDKFRLDLDNYAQAILSFAEKKGVKEITPELLLKINNKNYLRNTLHIGSGLGVAALFLSTLIPKFQYWVTKYRTGSDGFPGVKDIK